MPYLDNFNRADGLIGGDWTTAAVSGTGLWRIVSNQAVLDAIGVTKAGTTIASVADGTWSVDLSGVTSSPAYMGILARSSLALDSFLLVNVVLGATASPHVSINYSNTGTTVELARTNFADSTVIAGTLSVTLSGSSVSASFAGNVVTFTLTSGQMATLVNTRAGMIGLTVAGGGAYSPVNCDNFTAPTGSGSATTPVTPITGTVAIVSAAGVRPIHRPAARPVVTHVLGCPEYEVFVLTRGGHVILGQLPKTISITWDRVLDDVSSAQVTVGGIGGLIAASCCDVLDILEPWVHEIGIYRNGKLVWIGPITKITISNSADHVIIDAKDLMFWLDRRLVITEVDSDEDTLLTTTFQQVWDIAVNQDASFRPTLLLTPGVKKGERTVLVEQNLYAGQVLREIGRTGLDYTTVVRKVYVHDGELALSAIATLLDDHWVKPPDIVIDGTEMASQWVVTGMGSGQYGADVTGGYPLLNDDGVIDPALTVGSPYGVLTRVVSEPTIDDQTSIDANAKSRHDLTGTAPAYVTGGDLSRYAPLVMDDLVPGVRIDVRLAQTCRTILTQYRLHRVNINAGTDNETVTISLAPLGTIAAEIVGGN